MENGFVCVDFDSTLFDFKGGFIEYLKTKGHDIDEVKIKDYWFKDTGIPEETIREYMKDVKMWEEFQKFYPRAEEGLKLLQKEFDTLAYTGCPDSDDVLEHKLRIIREYGFMSNSTPYRACLKKPVILEAAALFDDHPGVHRDWIEAGYTGKLYMIRQSYNDDLTNFEKERINVCDSFYEAVQLFFAQLKISN